MKRRNLFRKTQSLPTTYPDVLMHHEIDFEKGVLNVDLIRKLLYLYSVIIILKLLKLINLNKKAYDQQIK